MEELFTNKYFTFAILIILAVVLFMYFNKSCRVENLSNIDLSTTAQDLVKRPYRDTSMYPYGRVNGPFDKMADELVKKRLGDPDMRFLPSVDERFRNYFNRGNKRVPSETSAAASIINSGVTS